MTTEKSDGQRFYEDVYCVITHSPLKWEVLGDYIRNNMEHRADRFLAPLRERIAELEKQNKILELKCSTSLANNLCPDHQDKQDRKPCLACEIETLEKRFVQSCDLLDAIRELTSDHTMQCDTGINNELTDKLIEARTWFIRNEDFVDQVKATVDGKAS